MGTQNFEIKDEAGGEHPDELGLRGASATYAPPEGPTERVTVAGNEHDVATDTWTVWVETGDGVVETTGEHVSEVDS